jgi:ankyrin repeat protein
MNDLIRYCNYSKNIDLKILKNLIKLEPELIRIHYCFECVCKELYINVEIIKIFIENGIDINCELKFGNTYFMYLCMNKNITFEILEFCISLGVNINKLSKYGISAFIILMSNPQLTFEMIELFIKNESNINISTIFDKNNGYITDKNNGFIICCKNDRIIVKIIKIFIDNGVDVNYCNMYGYSAIFYILKNKSTTFEIVELFLPFYNLEYFEENYNSHIFIDKIREWYYSQILIK